MWPGFLKVKHWKLELTFPESLGDDKIKKLIGYFYRDFMHKSGYYQSFLSKKLNTNPVNLLRKVFVK